MLREWICEDTFPHRSIGWADVEQILQNACILQIREGYINIGCNDTSLLLFRFAKIQNTLILEAARVAQSVER